MAGTLAELLYDIATDALHQQEREVMELRGRTQALLTGSALVASFFGAAAIDRKGLGPAEVAAMVSLAWSIVTSIYVLMPRTAAFVIAARDLHDRLYGKPEMRTIHTTAAYMLQRLREPNERVVKSMSRAFQLGLGGLAAQILLWAWALTVQ